MPTENSALLRPLPLHHDVISSSALLLTGISTWRPQVPFSVYHYPLGLPAAVNSVLPGSPAETRVGIAVDIYLEYVRRQTYQLRFSPRPQRPVEFQYPPFSPERRRVEKVVFPNLVLCIAEDNGPVNDEPIRLFSDRFGERRSDIEKHQ